MRTASSSAQHRLAGPWLRFTGAVVVLLVVTVGIPVGLIVAARAGLYSSSPIPGIGSLDEIRDWATTQRSSTELARVALRVLISLCWLLWGALVLSVLSSVLQSRPRFGHVRIPRVTMFEGLGTWIVAGLTALTSLAPNVSHATSTSAPPLPAAAVAAVTRTAALSTAQAVAAARSTVETAALRAGWGTVQAAESLEMFTARNLGSPDRWGDVFELNKGRVMTDGVTFTHPWKVNPGWQLELPAASVAASGLPIVNSAQLGSAVTDSPAQYRPLEEITVEDGDNLWDLAESRLRSVTADDSSTAVAGLVSEVVSINPTIKDPNLVFTGQRILMPAVGTPPAGPAATPPPGPPPSSSPVVAAAERTHTIVYGDTLWDILEATYGYVDVPLVHDVAAFNQLSDPNNIPIGTVIRLPDLPGPTAVTEAPADVAVAPAPVPAANVPLELPPPVVDRASPAANDVIAGAPPASRVTVSPEPTPPPLRLVPSPPTDVPAPVPTSSPVPWAIGGAASVALATGLLELLRRRRRARWASGGSAWQVGAASEPPPIEVVDTADLITVEWVAAALSHLAAHTDAGEAALVSVEYDEAVLSVRWDQPRPAAPGPWWASEDASVWNLPSSARLAPSEDGPLVGFPGLVTLGERDGRQYLINLAALRAVAIDGPGADALAGSIVLELAAGELLSDCIVHLHGVELTACEQLDRVVIGFDDELEPSNEGLHVSVIESDDPQLDELSAAADQDSRRALLILGASQRSVGAELRVQSDGRATHEPAGLAFHASLVPGVLATLDVAEPVRTSEPANEREDAAEPNVVRLDRSARVTLNPPRMVLRLFSNLLPDLDPRPAGVDARVMTIIAALHHLGAGRPPQQLAELLRIKPKTIQNKLGRLRELQLVHSDGNIWTLDPGVRSDADWLRDLAEHARDASSRETAARSLNECWELLTRATGPAYANGGGSSLWSWVDERDQDLGGSTATEQATATLFQAVRVAVETWDTLASTGLDDLFSPDRLVDLLLRLESTLHAVEPWPLFEGAALAAARTGLASTRQKLTTRLAQLVHDSDLEPPDELVAHVIG